MTSYFELARNILAGEKLEDKLQFEEVQWGEWIPFGLPRLPGRSGKLIFSDLQMKFPKTNKLNDNDKKAMALHSFANHELLAIEMMASAILIYPHETEEDLRFKRGIFSTLKDEQKHLSLYIRRLNELGYEFGDFPLNDYFWRQMEKLQTAAQYTAVMALTFESANLDFAQYYGKIFKEFGDQATADIMQTVLDDEISHVAFGAHWMKRWKQDKNLWDYYLSSLPLPLTPARSRGIGFDSKLHAIAINDEEYISKLSAFDDGFKITKRNDPS